MWFCYMWVIVCSHGDLKLHTYKEVDAYKEVDTCKEVDAYKEVDTYKEVDIYKEVDTYKEAEHRNLCMYILMICGHILLC